MQTRSDYGSYDSPEFQGVQNEPSIRQSKFGQKVSNHQAAMGKAGMSDGGKVRDQLNSNSKSVTILTWVASGTTIGATAGLFAGLAGLGFGSIIGAGVGAGVGALLGLAYGIYRAMKFDKEQAALNPLEGEDEAVDEPPVVIQLGRGENMQVNAQDTSVEPQQGTKKKKDHPASDMDFDDVEEPQGLNISDLFQQ
jgi:hypothetical protein